MVSLALCINKWYTLEIVPYAADNVYSVAFR